MTTKTFSINVGASEAGTRLDKFLAKRFPDHSRNYFQQLIKKGKISVNENPADKDASLKPDDLVLGELEPVGEISIAPDSSVKFKVIRDAKEFAVVEKPAGLVTHPSATHKRGTLVNGLLARWPEIAGVGEDPSRPGIVHRLDKETSGLMVVAKTQPMYLWLKKQFQDRKVEKKYIALVFGKMSQKEGEISVEIARHKTKQITVPVANKSSTFLLSIKPNTRCSGKVLDKGFSGNAYKSRKASTGFKILDFYPVRSSRAAVLWTRAIGASATSNGVYDGFTLVEVTPKTGRMHQIRVHFKHIGHPLAGDKTYASKRVLSALPMERHFLHAGYLAFDLPSGEKAEFSSDLPADLKVILNGLARAKFLDKD